MDRCRDPHRAIGDPRRRVLLSWELFGGSPDDSDDQRRSRSSGPSHQDRNSQHRVPFPDSHSELVHGDDDVRHRDRADDQSDRVDGDTQRARVFRPNVGVGRPKCLEGDFSYYRDIESDGVGYQRIVPWHLVDAPSSNGHGGTIKRRVDAGRDQRGLDPKPDAWGCCLPYDFYNGIV